MHVNPLYHLAQLHWFLLKLHTGFQDRINYCILWFFFVLIYKFRILRYAIGILFSLWFDAQLKPLQIRWRRLLRVVSSHFNRCTDPSCRSILLKGYWRDHPMDNRRLSGRFITFLFMLIACCLVQRENYRSEPHGNMVGNRSNII